jgi:hypothetical protein
MHINIKDLGAGALFLAIGLFFTLNSWFNLPIGNGYPMGPGFFPIGLGIVLSCFGIGLLAKGARGEPSDLGVIPKRGLPLICLSVLAFAVMVEGMGALPAFFVSTFLAAMAPSDATWKSAVVITVALTAFCVVVFIYALRLPYPLIGPWLISR